MKTLAETFAERFGGRPETVERRLFWRCLYRRTFPFLPLLALRARHFRPDRTLLEGAVKAHSLRQIEEEINEYLLDPDNMHWLRRRAGFRISTRRLQRLARQCLPDQTRFEADGRN